MAKDITEITDLEEYKKEIIRLTKEYKGGCPEGKADWLATIGATDGTVVEVSFTVTAKLYVEDLKPTDGPGIHKAVREMIETDRIRLAPFVSRTIPRKRHRGYTQPRAVRLLGNGAKVSDLQVMQHVRGKDPVKMLARNPKKEAAKKHNPAPGRGPTPKQSKRPSG